MRRHKTARHRSIWHKRRDNAKLPTISCREASSCQRQPQAKAGRTITALWNAVGSLVDLFTPAECANYFKAAGYDPD